MNPIAGRRELIDGQGVAFSAYWRSLPKRAADFRPARIIRRPRTVTAYRQKWVYCQLCGRSLSYDLRDPHHIIGGAGRSDEVCNLILVCRDCHRSLHGQCAEGESTKLPTVLWAKHYTDQPNTDWRRLAVLYRRFLPRPRSVSRRNQVRLRAAQADFT